MNQTDDMVEMLSERRAGSKLKRISILSDEDLPVSTMRFTFQDRENENIERHIIVWGKDLGLGFGSTEI